MGHIQIRNVPEDVHRTLKARAAKAGMSLSEYLLRDVVEFAARPTLEEAVERIRSRPKIQSDFSAADALRAAREERERELDARL